MIDDPHIWHAWGSIISGAISAIGGLIGGERANAANQEMAQNTMDFQERMSSTAHQREVADLKAAGLNPILSARLGGSSSPTGVTPTMVDTVGPAVQSGVSTTMQAMRMDAELDKIRADTEVSRAQANNVNADTALKVADTDNRPLQADQIRALTERAREEIRNMPYIRDQMHQSTRTSRADEELKGRYSDIAEQELSSAKAQATADKLKDEFLKSGRFAEGVRTLGYIMKELGFTGNSAVSNLRR